MLKEKNNIEKYKKLINSLIIDKNIREEILEKIEYFNNHGVIKIEKKNLYGKIHNKNNNDYIEIRYENNYFICNYTAWHSSKYVNIAQKDLKGENTKIDRKEKIEYKCFNNMNQTSIEEIEKIYNKNKELAYESELKRECQYDTYKDSIEYYNDSPFNNNFSLNKQWYIKNGSIIKYSISKQNFYEDCKLEENYSICPQKVYDGLINYYAYIDLDRELFKMFMSGEISIEEVLEKVDIDSFNNAITKRLIRSNEEFI